MSKPQPAEDFEIASQPAPTRAGTRSLGWIALIVLTAGLSYGAGRRISTDSIAEAATDARLSMVPSVRTVTAYRLAGGELNEAVICIGSKVCGGNQRGRQCLRDTGAYTLWGSAA